jgi:hypothetical protein
VHCGGLNGNFASAGAPRSILGRTARWRIEEEKPGKVRSEVQDVDNTKNALAADM